VAEKANELAYVEERRSKEGDIELTARLVAELEILLDRKEYYVRR